MRWRSLQEIRRVADEFERRNYYLRLKELSGFDMEIPLIRKHCEQPEKAAV